MGLLSSVQRRTRFTLRGYLLCLGGAWLLLPPALASTELKAPDNSASSRAPAEQALTGGVVSLRAKASLQVRIPHTNFLMGSTPVELIDTLLLCNQEPYGELCNQQMFADELPKHPVSVSSFLLDRTEVTVAAYERCVRAGHCKPIQLAGAERFERPNYPRTSITFNEAQAFCEYRGARLPTEAEWEAAARGNNNRKYPWGNLYNSRRANHGRFGFSEVDASDGFAELAPVGSFPSGRTPQGVLDMAGNAAEWVSGFYSAYTLEKKVNPKPSSGPSRVVRGGHFQSAAPWLRSAARIAADADVRRPYIGFRCAKSLPRTRIKPAESTPPNGPMAETQPQFTRGGLLNDPPAPQSSARAIRTKP